MKKADSTSAPSQDTHGYGWKFWLWLTSAFLIVLIVAVIGTAWVVKNATGQTSTERMALNIAQFPDFVALSLNELWSYITGEPLRLLMDRKTTEQSHWIRHFPVAEDTGYLLFAGIDPLEKQSIVQLIRISDGVPTAQWNIDWKQVFAQSSNKKFAALRGFAAGIAFHPLLLADGDVIFNTGYSLVRQSPCSPKPIWVLDEMMHHSNELDETGDALWIPSVAHDGLADKPWLNDFIRDDALAHISTDGRLLDRRSFARILLDNGLDEMIMGNYGVGFNADPFHLNQIQVARQGSRYWKRGDLLISAKNLSTLFLYRPSTNKIIWHQTGPWMNQHSVDFVDDHSISVFNNNVVSGAPESAFMKPGATNQVLVYDFDTKLVSQPFAAPLAEAKPRTITEGRARMLPDGGLFLEETNSGRDMRFTKDKLLWSRVNDYDDKRIGMVSWSRYLTAEEASVPLKALASRQCQSVKRIR